MNVYYHILGEYIACGSDDGRWFIWEKQTGRLMKVLVGDEAGFFFALFLFITSSINI